MCNSRSRVRRNQPACIGSKQESPKKDAKQPNEAEMLAMMMELAKLGDNHKLLANGVGTWTYTKVG
jgi:hypothetical protein